MIQIHNQILIGNSFEAGQEVSEMVLNPRNGSLIIEIPEASTAQVDRAVAAAKAAFSTWSRTTPAERSALLLRIADRVEAEADVFAALEALNCGKPINALTAWITVTSTKQVTINTITNRFSETSSRQPPL